MNSLTIQWVNGSVKLIDQTKLPGKLNYIICKDVKALWWAIKRLSVRGAPALGVAAAFGILLGIKKYKGKNTDKFIKHINDICKYIGSSRPTAVNLFNAMDQMKEVVIRNNSSSVLQLRKLLKQEALKIYEKDRSDCRAMGKYGTKFIMNGRSYLTICNAGALATVDFGTALGVFYSAKQERKKFKVYVCETRPLLQGSRLTAWELMRAKIDITLICDNMAATLMKQGKVDGIFVGADRIASNGDAANKIGTYNLAVLAKYHKVPFYIVAPFTTFDIKIKTGNEIPIEERASSEVRGFGKIITSPEDVKVYNPAFDVTDNKLITAIITEKGIINSPYKLNIKRVFSRDVS